MNEPTNNHQDQTKEAYQEILKVKEGFEMKVTNHITDVTTWLSKGLSNKTPAKVLGGLAVGALILAATGLAMGREFTGEVGLPTASDSIQAPVEVQWDLEDIFNHSLVGLPTASDSIQELVEVQWDLEDIFNHSSVGLPTASDSIQELVEVQWDLEDMFNHSSVGLPTASDRIQVIPDDEWIFNSPFHQDFS